MLLVAVKRVFLQIKVTDASGSCKTRVFTIRLLLVAAKHMFSQIKATKGMKKAQQHTETHIDAVTHVQKT